MVKQALICARPIGRSSGHVNASLHLRHREMRTFSPAAKDSDWQKPLCDSFVKYRHAKHVPINYWKVKFLGGTFGCLSCESWAIDAGEGCLKFEWEYVWCGVEVASGCEWLRQIDGRLMLAQASIQATFQPFSDVYMCGGEGTKEGAKNKFPNISSSRTMNSEDAQ
jgi:hypothetical protein